jgi:hypothetical protein
MVLALPDGAQAEETLTQAGDWMSAWSAHRSTGDMVS